MSRTWSQNRHMIVRIGIRNPDTQAVAEVVGEAGDYESAKAAAVAKIPEGAVQLHIYVDRG